MKHAEKHTLHGGERIRDSGVKLQKPLPVVEDKDEAEGENSHHVNAQRQQEEEEVAVVPPSDAVVHPGTVVVKVLRGRVTVNTAHRAGPANIFIFILSDFKLSSEQLDHEEMGSFI